MSEERLPIAKDRLPEVSARVSWAFSIMDRDLPFPFRPPRTIEGVRDYLSLLEERAKFLSAWLEDSEITALEQNIKE